MAEARNLKGTVEDKAGRRYQAATVRLEGEKVAPAFASTNSDGDFEFDLSDQERWPSGDYDLMVFHEDLQTPSRPLSVKLEGNESPKEQEITLVAKQHVSWEWGIGFLIAMFVALACFLGLYFYLHTDPGFDSWKTSSFDADLSQMVGVATKQAELLADTSTGGGGSATAVVDSIQVAQTMFTDLRKTNENLFSPEKAAVVESLLEQAIEAGETDHAFRLLTLKELESALIDRSAFFWSFYPWRLLEVLFWALTATLIRLIFNTGWYLYQRCFYSNAIPHHLALIVTVPILAVLIAFVLSLVRIDIQVSDVELDLDLTNVTISILVGALIGLAPWKAWDFMRDLADIFFQKLRNTISSATSGDSAPTPAPTAAAAAPEAPAAASEEASEAEGDSAPPTESAPPAESTTSAESAAETSEDKAAKD